MAGNIFLIDSNVLVYAFDSSERAKHEIAKKILKKCFFGDEVYAVSIQNLSEFFVNITKKVEKPIQKNIASNIIKKIIMFNGFVKIEPNVKTVVKAMDISANENASYWDSLVAATMIENSVFHIYTENTKDFLNIKGIEAVNPFVRASH